MLAEEYLKWVGSLPAVAAPAAPAQGWFSRMVAPRPPQEAIQPLAAPKGVPVTNISYDDAQIFVDKLSAACQQNYRIPSEAEWEYACRAGSGARYSSGDTIDQTRAAFALASGPVPVGAYPPNGFGLYDMHGNVREWAADLWHDSYDLTPQDGRPALDGHSSMRLVRGGGWRDSAVMLRSTAAIC